MAVRPPASGLASRVTCYVYIQVKVREGKQSLPNTFNTDDLDQILAHPLEAMSTDNLRKKRRGSWIMAFQRPPSVMGAPAARIKYDLTRMCGSLLYMAPEVYHGASYCEKCDVFSLGIVMFEIATRTPMVDAINLFGRKMTVKAFVKEVRAPLCNSGHSYRHSTQERAMVCAALGPSLTALSVPEACSLNKSDMQCWRSAGRKRGTAAHSWLCSKEHCWAHPAVLGARSQRAHQRQPGSG